MEVESAGCNEQAGEDPVAWNRRVADLARSLAHSLDTGSCGEAVAVLSMELFPAASSLRLSLLVRQGGCMLATSNLLGSPPLAWSLGPVSSTACGIAAAQRKVVLVEHRLHGGVLHDLDSAAAMAVPVMVPTGQQGGQGGVQLQGGPTAATAAPPAAAAAAAAALYLGFPGTAAITAAHVRTLLLVSKSLAPLLGGSVQRCTDLAEVVLGLKSPEGHAAAQRAARSWPAAQQRQQQGEVGPGEEPWEGSELWTDEEAGSELEEEEEEEEEGGSRQQLAAWQAGLCSGRQGGPPDDPAAGSEGLLVAAAAAAGPDAAQQQHQPQRAEAAAELAAEADAGGGGFGGSEGEGSGSGSSEGGGPVDSKAEAVQEGSSSSSSSKGVHSAEKASAAVAPQPALEQQGRAMGWFTLRFADPYMENQFKVWHYSCLAKMDAVSLFLMLLTHLMLCLANPDCRAHTTHPQWPLGLVPAVPLALLFLDRRRYLRWREVMLSVLNLYIAAWQVAAASAHDWVATASPAAAMPPLPRSTGARLPWAVLDTLYMDGFMWLLVVAVACQMRLTVHLPVQLLNFAAAGLLFPLACRAKLGISGSWEWQHLGADMDVAQLQLCLLRQAVKMFVCVVVVPMLALRKLEGSARSLFLRHTLQVEQRSAHPAPFAAAAVMASPSG